MRFRDLIATELRSLKQLQRIEKKFAKRQGKINRMIDRVNRPRDKIGRVIKKNAWGTRLFGLRINGCCDLMLMIVDCVSLTLPHSSYADNLKFIKNNSHKDSLKTHHKLEHRLDHFEINQIVNSRAF